MITSKKIYSSFSVPDLKKAKEFYGKTLGLNVNERPEGLDLELSGDQKVFIYFSPRNKPADFTVLNFVVDDVEKEVDKLLEKGLAMERYDMPGVKIDQKGITRDDKGHTMAWFKDPADNILALLQKSKK